MKKKIISFLLFFIAFQVQSQEVEHIVIQKDEVDIYQGVLKETENWFVFVDSSNYHYLANISSAESDILGWFNRFKDSQNIYRQFNFLKSSQYTEIVFYKINQPEERLSFYYAIPEKGEIILTLINDGQVFRFQKLD